MKTKMGKSYSMQFVLALIMSACCFISCGDDDEDKGTGTAAPSFTVTHNETTEVYSGLKILTLGASCDIENDKIDFRFYTDAMITFHWVFPYKTYGNIDASYFDVGFSDFTDMYLYDIGNAAIDHAKHSCDYVSGRARVVANDGEYITIKFDKLSFSVERYYGIVNYVFDGTLKFEINDLTE